MERGLERGFMSSTSLLPYQIKVPLAYSSEGSHVLAILKSYGSLEDIRRGVCEQKEVEVDANT